MHSLGIILSPWRFRYTLSVSVSIGALSGGYYVLTVSVQFNERISAYFLANAILRVTSSVFRIHFSTHPHIMSVIVDGLDLRFVFCSNLSLPSCKDNISLACAACSTIYDSILLRFCLGVWENKNFRYFSFFYYIRIIKVKKMFDNKS